MEARVAVSCGCALGESALWDARTGVFYWVDILAPALWRLEASNEVFKLPLAERIGFVALTSSPAVLLAGFKSGLALLDTSTGDVHPLVSPEPSVAHNRINDGTVAPDGTVYFGTMDDDEAEATGTFWRFDGKRLDRFGPSVIVSNGPAVSPDGRRLYFVDSVGRHVFVRDLTVPDTGRTHTFVRFEESWGYPDGMSVDAEGHVWVCHWGAGRITRFTPAGAPDAVVNVPTANVTKCTFGGPGLDTMYITTAAVGRDHNSDPCAGDVFTVRPGVRGAPTHAAHIALPGAR